MLEEIVLSLKEVNDFQGSLNYEFIWEVERLIQASNDYVFNLLIYFE